MPQMSYYKLTAEFHHKKSMDIRSLLIVNAVSLLSGFSGLSFFGRSFFLLIVFLISSFLLLEELREELLISLGGLAGSLPGRHLTSLVERLSSESLLGDESLDARRFVVGLITLGNISLDNVFTDIILLPKGESLSNLSNSLRSESSGSLGIGEASDISGTLLEDLEGNDAEIGSTDAASDGLSLPLTRSSGSVGLGSGFHEDFDTAVHHDTLFHGESLLVVTAGDSESVALEFFAKDDTVDIRAHSSVVEVAIDLIVINFSNNLLSSDWISDVIFHCVSGIMIESTAG